MEDKQLSSIKIPDLKIDVSSDESAKTTSYSPNNSKLESANTESVSFTPATTSADDSNSFSFDFFTEIGIFFQKLYGNDSADISKNEGIKCFNSTDLENIPSEEDIENVKYDIDPGEKITVTLKNGEEYEFSLKDNKIEFKGFKGTDGAFLNFNFDDLPVNNIVKTEAGYDIKTKNGVIYHYKFENYTGEYKGEKYEGKRYVLDSVDSSNTDFYQFHRDINDEDEESVNNFLRDHKGNNKLSISTNKKNNKINGYVSHTISTPNGTKTYKLYCYGESVDQAKFAQAAEKLFSELDKYPDNVKDYIMNSKLDVFVYGTSADIGDGKSAAYGGFTTVGKPESKRYIFFNDTDVDDSSSTLFHEMGHIIDLEMNYKTPERTSIWSTPTPEKTTDPELKELYDINKEKIQQLSNIRYTDEGGVPNEEEFFAELSNVYFTQPDELKTLLPDCYDYIKNFYDNL